MVDCVILFQVDLFFIVSVFILTVPHFREGRERVKLSPCEVLYRFWYFCVGKSLRNRKEVIIRGLKNSDHREVKHTCFCKTTKKHLVVIVRILAGAEVFPMRKKFPRARRVSRNYREGHGCVKVSFAT